MPQPPCLSAIHIYPVKSLHGVRLTKADAEPWGLAGDRRWMLVGKDAKAITQRDHPGLALVRVEYGPDGSLRFRTARDTSPPVAVPDPAGKAPPDAAPVSVRIWQDTVRAVRPFGEVHRWFSEYLGEEASLVHLDAPGRRRPLDPEYARPGETVTFADSFPLLLTTTGSLTALNDLITQEALASGGQAPDPLPMDRFRPNLVIDGTDAWQEDNWRRVRIGEVSFRVGKPCARCTVTTIDQKTAERGLEPLRTLGRHRRSDTGLLFGQYLVPESTGVLRVGDPFTVLA